MADSGPISMPSGMGGLMRYDAEYASRFMLTPGAVVGFIAVVVAFVVLIRVFMPVGA